MIQITVPTPVKEESKKEESTKEESPTKTSSTSPTTLTQPIVTYPIVTSLIPTVVPAPNLTPAQIKHELSKAQLLAKELKKCRKIKNKRIRAKCVAAAKKRYSSKKK